METVVFSTLSEMKKSNEEGVIRFCKTEKHAYIR